MLLPARHCAYHCLGLLSLAVNNSRVSVPQGCSPWHGPRAMEEAKSCGTSTGQPTPLPLVHGVSGDAATVTEQPCDLSTLKQRYADFGAKFIKEQSAAKKPWYLFASFSHVHVTDANYSKALPPPGYSPWQFSSEKFCGSSGRGGTGDAVQELDDAVGQLMASVLAAGVDDNTITFFTSDNGNPEYGDMRGNLPLVRPCGSFLLFNCCIVHIPYLRYCHSATMRLLVEKK